MELTFKEIDEVIDKLSDKIKEYNGLKSIGLIGDLGVGKTYISKRICKNLGIKENVKSPTFTYLLEYEIPNMKIVHFDLYRLSNADELYEVGYEDYLLDDNRLLLIEWANNVLEMLPSNTLFLELKHLDIESRILEIYLLEGGEKKYVNIDSYNFN